MLPDPSNPAGPPDAGMEHLFRRESGRMVAAVTRVFGVHNLALAEDVVQDAFCRALEVWSIRGMPDNPAAWLVASARRRAIDALRRERTARTFAPELGRLLDSEWTMAQAVGECFEPDAVRDALLRMMFSCCHPDLSEESQVALILHVLCGFGVGEVASAFVCGHAAAEKRITRAKHTLARSESLFDVSAPDALHARLPGVQRAIYLLFNEGYHGASPEFAVRADLCREAVRLADLLAEPPLTPTPATHALGALMRLNAARLPGRLDARGDLNALGDQDRSLWDHAMIAEGLRRLSLSASGDEVSEYHIEAAIASVHAVAPTPADTDWARIVRLYDALVRVRPSPVVALNRAIALAQHAGPRAGLDALAAIEQPERLRDYPFYHAALGDLTLRLGEPGRARAHFLDALALARNPAERRFLEQRARACV